MIAEFQHLASGVDLINAEVCTKCNEPIDNFVIPATDKFWVTYKIHTFKGETGILKEIIFDRDIK